MKLAIAGSRSLEFSVATLNEILERHFDTSTIREVVSGGAVGVDQSGERWAKAHDIKVTQFRPDWSKGKRGGPDRNRRMAVYCDRAIVIHQNTPGSKNMVKEMKRLGKKVVEVTTIPNWP